MKIIKKGDVSKKWWDGLKVCCAVCGQEIELEAGDEKSMRWCQMCSGAVEWACDCCGGSIPLNGFGE